MNKLMKKAAILATVATMATMAISTSASAKYVSSSNEINQYEVKDHEQYTIVTNHRSGATTARNVFVTKVYEKDGRLFGTNRAIQWIDIDTGKNGESLLGTWGDTDVYEYGTIFTWVS